MTMVGTALNLGEKMKIYPHVMTFFHKTSKFAISRCCFAGDSKEMDKSEKCTCRACKIIVFSHQELLQLGGYGI